MTTTAALLTSLMVLLMSLLAVSRSSGRALFNNLAKSWRYRNTVEQDENSKVTLTQVHKKTKHKHTWALSSWSKTDSVVLCGGGAIITLSGSLGSFFTIPKTTKRKSKIVLFLRHGQTYYLLYITLCYTAATLYYTLCYAIINGPIDGSVTRTGYSAWSAMTGDDQFHCPILCWSDNASYTRHVHSGNDSNRHSWAKTTNLLHHDSPAVVKTESWVKKKKHI